MQNYNKQSNLLGAERVPVCGPRGLVGFSVQCQTPTILLWLERNFSQELTKAEGHK